MKRTTVLVPTNIKAKAIVFVTCLLSTAFSGSAPEQQLVAHWSFDESENEVYRDKTGHGYDAAGVNTGITDGISGLALNLDGITSSVSVPTSTGQFNFAQYSIEALIYSNVDPTVAAQTAIFENTQVMSGVSGGYALKLVDGCAHSTMSTPSSGGWQTINSPVTLMARRWYHLATTFDGTNLKLFVNGTQVQQRTISGTYYPSQTLPAYIGCEHYLSSLATGEGTVVQRLNGKIDELKLYNYALSAEVIAKNFASYNMPVPPVATPKLLAHWSFDSSANNTVFYDASGNSHTATCSKALATNIGVRGKALESTVTGYSFQAATTYPEFSAPNFSIEAWVYSYINLVNVGSFYNFKSILDYQTFSVSSGGPTKGYHLDITDAGKLQLTIAPSTGGWLTCVGSTVLKPNAWYHVAGTYDGSIMKVYVNGVLEKSVPHAGGYVPPDQNASIGCQMSVEGPRNWFDGMIDELKVYNYALDAQVLKATYEALKPAVKPPFEINIGMKTTYAQPGDTVTMPVYIANHEEYAISALQLSLKYDPVKLTLLSVSKDSGIVRTLEMFDWNNTTPGSVPVAMAGTTVRLGYGEGELFRCVFVVASSAGSGDTCRVNLDKVVIDESNGLVVSTTQSGRIIITKKSLLYGDVTGNDQVTVVDAQQVLQFVVGALTLPDAACCPNFTVAVADVSGNGSVTSYDAALIFQYSLGLLPGFPVETGTGRPFGKRSADTVNKASLNIAVNNEVKDAIVYDLVGTKMGGFYAGEFAVYCDAPAELIAKSTITTAVRGATLSSRYVAEDHLLRVAVSSNDDIDTDGPVAIVRITLPNAQQSTARFSVKTALVNEGAIATDFNNGGLVGLLPAKTSLVSPAAGFRMTGSQLAVYRAAASSAATVTVWDLCGRMVARKVVKGAVATIDFNKYGKGAYVVRLNDGAMSATSRVVLLGR